WPRREWDGPYRALHNPRPQGAQGELIGASRAGEEARRVDARLAAMGDLELRREGGDHFAVIAGNRLVGTVTLSHDTDGTTAHCELEPVADLMESGQLIRKLEALGADRIDTNAILVRVAARDAGYGGPLRSP